jgi:hypothetical protein
MHDRPKPRQIARQTQLAALEEVLAFLQEAHRVLAQATSVGEVKFVLDRMQAYQGLAKSTGMGRDVETQVAEVMLRLECKAGQLLAAEHLRGGDRKSDRQAMRLRLRDLRISYNHSAQWQRIAAVPPELFDEYLRQAAAEGKGPTASGLLRFADARGLAMGTSAHPSGNGEGGTHQTGKEAS